MFRLVDLCLDLLGFARFWLPGGRRQPSGQPGSGLKDGARQKRIGLREGAGARTRLGRVWDGGAGLWALGAKAEGRVLNRPDVPHAAKVGNTASRSGATARPGHRTPRARKRGGCSVKSSGAGDPAAAKREGARGDDNCRAL